MDGHDDIFSSQRRAHLKPEKYCTYVVVVTRLDMRLGIRSSVFLLLSFLLVLITFTRAELRTPIDATMHDELDLSREPMHLLSAALSLPSFLRSRIPEFLSMQY